METGISKERAIALICEKTKVSGTEYISARDASGRVLAEDVIALSDQPPWPRSPLDGYALRSCDTKGAVREHPLRFRIIDTIYAGSWSEKRVGEMEAVRLMTGAPIPQGCDCVIRQEETVHEADTVEIAAELHPWENYCFAGEDFARGDVILPKGTRLCGNALGVLSSAGMYREDMVLPVYGKIRCALFCTGDELVPNSVRPLPKGKIYSGNEALLVSRLEDLGIEISSCRGYFGDDPEALASSVKEALASADAVITTGGVSVGVKDILHETLDLLEAERVFWRVKLKPGTPLMFSMYHGKPILSLSGNPFAASATFELFARPMLARLTGAEDLLPLITPAVLSDPFMVFGKVPRYVRAVFHDGCVSFPTGHSSGMLSSSVNTNCLAELPPRDHPFERGETVKVYLL